jgi:DNA-binding beta-propeller fold protein YncE
MTVLRRMWLWAAFGLVLLLTGFNLAHRLSGNRPAEEPPWPKVNVATAYVVDPAWPRKPASVRWDKMAGVAVDAHDNVYLFTRGDPPVQVYDADGNYLRGWGRDTLAGAHHIRIDPEGNVWAADVDRHVVRMFTPEGRPLQTLGTLDHPGNDDSHFNAPTDMAVTPAGDVFVSDGYGNARVAHFDRDGRFVKAWGQLGSKPGRFSIPHSIVADSKGRLYVADRNNARIQVFDPDGRLLDVWDNLLIPWGLCMTGDDELWACGSSPAQWRPEDLALGTPPRDQLFMCFNTAGKLLQLWTVPNGIDGLEKPGELNWVHAIAVDSHGNLFVADVNGKRAQKFVRRAP